MMTRFCSISFAVGIGLLLMACGKTGKDSTQPLSPEEKQNLNSLAHTNPSTTIPDNGNTGASTNDLGQACFNQICSQAPDINAALANSSPIDADVSRQLDNLIPQLYQLQAQNYAQLKKQNFSDFKPSDEVADVALAGYSLVRMFQESSFLTYSQNDSSYHFDFNQYLLKHGSDSLAINQNIVDEIEVILSLPSLKALLQGYSLNEYFDKLMKASQYANPLDFAAAIARDVDKTLADFSKPSGEPYHTILVVKKALAKQELSGSEQKLFMEQYFKAELAKEVMYGRLRGKFTGSGFAATPLYKKMMATSVDQVYSRTFSYKADRQKSCLANLKRSISWSLTDAEISQLENTVALVQQLAKKEVQDFVKDPIQLQAVSYAIDKTIFKIPDSRREVSAAILQDYQDQLSNEKPLKGDLIWGNFFISLGYETESDDSSLSSIKNECNNYLPEKLSDHALTSLGNISLSIASGKDRRLGLGVAAHEMGHIVFSALIGGGDHVPSDMSAFGSVSSVFSCELNRLSGQSLYLNESFADTFSAHVMVKAADQTDLTNVGCALVSYANSGDSLLNSNKNDPHPANFFRALIYNEDMFKSLPQTCTDFLTSQGSPSLTSCY